MALSTIGFVDLQVNGFAGVDFNDPACTVEDYQTAVAATWTTGVTRLFPTIVTADGVNMRHCLETASLAAETRPIGPSIAGIHLEGPWISPEDGPRGAHLRQHVRKPDREEFSRLQESAQGRIKVVTLAPELDGAIDMIEWFTAQGVLVSIGHSMASSAQIGDAVRAGARLSTHLGNGCAETIHRHHNLIWEQLASDELCASFIVDGHHLPPAMLKSMIRAKSVARSFLVTDATAPAGCDPGPFKFGDQDVELTAAGRVQLAGTSRLAGSALRMNDAVANTVRLAGVSWEDALAMAGPQAASAVGMSFPNDRVSFEISDDKLSVCATIREGETLWAKA
jgi:N-acetylglucosamine-6-phosphate deacetylase